MAERLNIRQLAARAGVSTSTVSRVLNNSGYVRDEVRARIEAVIAETGYVPSGVAKNLKASVTDTVGVIIPRINSHASSEVTAGISVALAEAGLVPLLGNSANRPEEELRYFDVFKRQRVRGAIILATVLSPAHVAAMRAVGGPVVVVGQDASALGFVSVIQDERRATREMTAALIAAGHRRIGLIGVGDWDVQAGHERRAGYLQALDRAGIAADPGWRIEGGFDFAEGARGVDRLMPRGDELTAILAVTDRLAIGAMSRLAERGIAVPGAVSVAGVGDSDMAQLFRPRLSAIGFDYQATGARAAQALLALLDGTAAGPQAQVMPYRLCPRDSIAAPPA